MIHKYKQNDLNIALDINSGSVHILENTAYDMLDYLSSDILKNNSSCPEDIKEKLKTYHSEDEINGAYSELLSLYNDEMLFSNDEYIEIEKTMSKDSPVKAMCLHIAHDCNLRCAYCFAGTGDYHHGRKLMPSEVGKKAIDFLIEKSGTRRNLEVDFFGGEPLMNFDVVKEIVEYARSLEKEHNKNFRFTITTNGVLLDDDKIDYINEHMSNVVLSLDGRKSVNDTVRKRVDGTGCYNTIVPKFQKLVKKRDKNKDYYVRGTFTKFNIDFSKDVLHMVDLGFKQTSIEPVIADPTAAYALTDNDLPQIYIEYENLSDIILNERKNGNWFNFFHFMIDLDQGPCVYKRLKGCGCGNEYVAITPDGDIYPCHQFVDFPEYKMGNLFDTTFNTEIKKNFANANVYTKEECSKCWAKFYCSGGCNANNYSFNKDILKPHTIACELEKKRVECAIYIKAKEMLSE